MKEHLLSALCHSLGGITTDQSAPRVIQKIFTCLSTELHASYSIVALKNPVTDYIEGAHCKDIFRDCCCTFKRGVGNNLIGRLFFAEPVVVVTPASPPEEYRELYLERDYAMALAARISYGGRTLGFLASYFDQPLTVDANLKNFFLGIGGTISIVLERAEHLQAMSELRRFDQSTGLLWNAYFMTKLDEELIKSQRYGWPLTIILLDLDNYKEILNLHGLERAQSVLVSVADGLKSCLRGVDVVGVAGTDEFIAYMPNTPWKPAETVMKRFRRLLASKAFTDRQISTSCAVGITQMREKETIDELVWRGQAALFTARQKGPGGIVVVP